MKTSTSCSVSSLTFSGRAIWLLSLLLVLGCASTKLTVPPSGRSSPVWQIPEAEFASQRLYRVHFDGPEGDGSLKLTLRLADSRRYKMTAANPLGRRVWALAVEGDEALLINYREKTFCRFTGGVEISAIPLGPLPFDTLPGLLLGRLPVRPDSALEQQANRVSYVDVQGRRWTASVDDGRLRQWTLWAEGEPVVWWSWDGRAAFLSARREKLQLRWREVTRERLAGTLEPTPVPDDYAFDLCE